MVSPTRDRVYDTCCCMFFFFFQAEDGIRDYKVTGVQTCALPISIGGEGTVRDAQGADEGRRQVAAAAGPLQEPADRFVAPAPADVRPECLAPAVEIGRASCRERV